MKLPTMKAINHHFEAKFGDPMCLVFLYVLNELSIVPITLIYTYLRVLLL